MRVKSGTYTGDGVNGRAITGLGFRPDLVLVSPFGPMGTQPAPTWTYADCSPNKPPSSANTVVQRSAPRAASEVFTAT